MMEPGTTKRYETPLCCLQCDRRGFVLTVGEAEIQGDRARLERWQRKVTRYVEGLLRGSEPIATHRVTVDGETYVLSNLQLFDLFTALAQAESQTENAPLPLVGLLGGTGFALGVVLTFGLLPRSPTVEVAQTAAPPSPPLESLAEEPAPPPPAALALPPARESVAKPAPPAASLPAPTPIRVTPRPPAPPTLAETRDRPAPQPLPLPVAELPIAPEPSPLAARRAEPDAPRSLGRAADPTPRLQAHLQSTRETPTGRTVLRLVWQPNQPPTVIVENTTLTPGAIAQLRRQIEDWSRQNPSGYEGTTLLPLVPGWNDSGPAAGSTTAPASPPRSSDLPETPPPAPAAN